jgi:NAD(P)-dependent dehydrogenase (short-subunit alcohol dehydrogenase family)
MVNTTVDTYGRIDILYNNAGIQKYALTVDVSEEDWAKMLDTNLTSVFLGSKYTIPYMFKQGGGVIISTASAQGFSGNVGTGPYTVTKAGIISLTKTMAAEYAKANIRINCICPGVIDTAMGGPWIPMVRMDLVPQGKAGKPEDIAKAALYLASDDSSYITGFPLVVDGGWLCQIILPMKDEFANK